MPESAATESVFHLLLCHGSESLQARTRVELFFEKNFLVKYDRVVIPTEGIIAATHPEFWPRLEAGVAENRRTVAKILAELRESGFRNLDDLAEMRQGYESKILHLVTHLLDGFFGIDSRFYNLEEEAHTVSERLSRTIRDNPGGFWLVEAECDTDNGHEADQIPLIRKFDVIPPIK